MKRKLATKLGSKGFIMLQRKLENMSVERAERFGERLGKLAYKVSKKHRKLARENLLRAFPEKTEQEREQLAQGVLMHFGRIMADFMRARNRTNEDVLASVEVSGLEHLNAAKEQGKGLILVTAHFGNWERMAHAVTALGYKLHVIARDTNDPEMTALVDELRKSAGTSLISRGNAAMPTLRALKKGEFVGILPDQNSDEIYVPFFGVPCGTVTGPAVLAKRGGVDIVPIYCVRVGVGKYRLWAEAPLQPEPGFDYEEGMTRAVNASLEAAIRTAPEQYLWIHNRWKSAKRRGLVPESPHLT